MKLFTDEQLNIINLDCTKRKLITIQSFAGTGKTSSMIELCKNNIDKKILYLTFNTTLSNETQSRINSFELNTHIDIMTVHSLAFNKVSDSKIHKLSNEYIKSFCNFNDLTQCVSFKNKLHNFCASNDFHINDNNIIAMLQTDMLSHDMYLKKFQLTKPQLHYDIVILDEVQDCTPCILDIVLRQKCTRILVGDIHQQIYAFRGVCDPFLATNNMSDIKLRLNNTFRFGPELAAFTSKFLNTFKNEKVSLCSQSNVQTHILKPKCDFFNLQRGTTILCKTNKQLLDNLITLSTIYNNIYIIGTKFNIDKEINILSDLYVIKHNLSNEFIQHPKLKYFQSIDDIKTHFILLQKHKWLLRICMFQNYGKKMIEHWLSIKSKLCEFQTDADVIVSNVHQIKGMEFDHVLLCDDFLQFKYKDDGSIRTPQWEWETYNLLYVAITRSKLSLILNSQLHSIIEHL